MGGKVQAPPGYADHVRFLYPDFCERCVTQLCIEMCSGQAITAGAAGSRRSIAKSASTAAPASGIARYNWVKTPREQYCLHRRRGRIALDGELGGDCPHFDRRFLSR